VHTDIITARIIIYAVKPWHWKEKFPVVNIVPAEYSRQVESKWKNKLKFLQEKGRFLPPWRMSQTPGNFADSLDNRVGFFIRQQRCSRRDREMLSLKTGFNKSSPPPNPWLDSHKEW